MISYDEARLRILDEVRPITLREKLAAELAHGRVLSADVVAVEPNPRFTNSALDGYAVSCAEDAVAGAFLTIRDEVAAGDAPKVTSKGEALRVFTGAPLLGLTYAVAYQEDTTRDGDSVTLLQAAPQGQGVRSAGSDFAQGEVILSEGDVLGAGALALLASQAVLEIAAFATPKVAVVVTGNEVSPTPSEFQIYDSNTPMLRAQVESARCDCDCKSIGDDFDMLRDVLTECAGIFDAIVVSGGASVGDYDFLARAVAEIGEIVFHGVSIKPGKPFLFGKIADKPLFGLPGNPASAFVTFELFVRPALMRLGGNSRLPKTTLVRLDTDFTTKKREEWLRCRFIDDGVVEPVAAQGSFGLRSIAAAEALVRVPAETRHKSGEIRTALLMQNATKAG